MPSSDDREHIQALRHRIAYLEKRLELYERQYPNAVHLIDDSFGQLQDLPSDLPLPLPDYRRYGRQMILDGFGLPGQLKLKNAAVLVVGAGGLGCPAVQYLAAAGIGKLGIVDHDVVELSNLQRQILHSDATIGMPKVDSCKLAVQRINPRVQVIPHNVSLTSNNAREIVSKYDVVLDCTDNLPTRYLLSDLTASTKTPLVSGAALKYDGQLAIYNYGENGPCFRCIFPKSPPKDAESSCEETGVLGTVTGIIGTLQALEAIKLIVGLHDGNPSLLIFSAVATPPFRRIRLRSKRPMCIACGSDPLFSATAADETDYVAFCGGEDIDRKKAGLALKEQRIAAEELQSVIQEDNDRLAIIDVRPPSEFSICHLPNSRNVPLPILMKSPSSYLDVNKAMVVVCRLGNDSQVAAQAMTEDSDIPVKDLIGGLRAWSELDCTFPLY